MDKLTYEQALGMLKYQAAVEEAGDAEYRNKPSTYMRYAWIHAAYLADTVTTFPNETDLIEEYLGYILACLLAEWVYCIPKDETVDDAAALLIEAMYSEEKWTAAQQAALDKYTDPLLLIDAFANLATMNVFNIKLFEKILELFDSSWADMELYFKDEADELQGNEKDDGAVGDAPPDRTPPSTVG